MTTASSELREHLAAYSHDAWSGWMEYLFSKCDIRSDQSVVIPAWAVDRWTRQMNTTYTDLPEHEKYSDRSEADKMLAIVNADTDGSIEGLLR